LAKGRVLDVGCGGGRHALHLQRKGLRVTGIDLSPLTVKICKARGLKDARALPIEGIDKLRPARYDTVLMLGNNFGLFGSFKKARTLLAKFHGITSESALIIAEILDPYRNGDPVHLRYHRINKRRGRMGGQVRLRVRYRDLVGPWHDYLLVSKPELRGILSGTDWRLQRAIEDGGAQYIAVIEKRAQKQR
ncbi:MAG: class I SAM-dependent methyltransferase, partial [Elusimicrobia bacterium]|nr:class I SAM-dependent methyltransferase [Elusimicrobiota bacterium]